MTVVGALTHDGMGPTTAFAGNLTTGSFIAYLMEDLLPFLLPGSVIIMDRLRVHCSDEVQHVVKAAGCEILLLPPYSPELNPIEEAWSKLKHLLRKLKARTLDGLLDGVAALVEQITSQDALGWIAHAGYRPRAES